MKKNNSVNCAECCFGDVCQAYLFECQEPFFVRNLSRKSKIAKGEYIYRRGEAVDELYALRSGSAKIYDKEQNLQGIFLAGQVVGAEDLYAGVHQYDVQATCDLEVCRLNCKSFYEISQVTTGFTDFIVQIVSRSAMEKQRFIDVLTKSDGYHKVVDFIALLSEMNKKYGFEHRKLELPLKKKELALLLGISQSTLTRALDALQKEQVIEMDNRVISIQTL